jgi:hypothetical protein
MSAAGPGRGRRDDDGDGRSRGLRADRRGQTLQDFATGVSLFVVVVAATITLLPPVLSPFDAAITADQSATASRLTDETVRRLTLAGSDNRLNASATTDFFSPLAAPTDEDDLQALYGTGERLQINVTLDTATATDPTIGAPYEGRSVAAVARVVADGGRLCRPSCRIVVRVW